MNLVGIQFRSGQWLRWDWTCIAGPATQALCSGHFQCQQGGSTSFITGKRHDPSIFREVLLMSSIVWPLFSAALVIQVAGCQEADSTLSRIQHIE